MIQRIVFICFIFFSLLGNTNGQFTVTFPNVANDLVRSIVGKGIVFSNATLTGSSFSAGIFANVSGEPGINAGVLLTTGRSGGVVSAANVRADNSMNQNGDPDLDILVQKGNPNLITRDACILEFDFIPQNDSISVRYVFASEEYPGLDLPLFNANCGEVNDIFAFLLSGGTEYVTPANIAKVPGTNIPVAINSINNGIIDQSHGTLSNCASLGAGSPFTQYYKDNRTSTKIVYNGMTVVLTATAKVTACSLYHIKLTIGDVGSKLTNGDQRYDSGVFLEAGSFSSIGASIKASSDANIYTPDSVPVIVQNCKNGKVVVTRSGGAVSSSGTLSLSYSGTAQNGVDYNLPATVSFAAGQKEATLIVEPLNSNFTGTKNIKIYVSSLSCASGIDDSTELIIKDSMLFTRNTHNTFICLSSGGDTVLMAPFSPAPLVNSYLWSPANATTQQITVSNTGNYIATHTYNNHCYDIDTFKVLNGDPLVNLGNNATICRSDNLILNAGNPGSQYLWSTGETTQSIMPKIGNNYWVRVTSPTTGCSVSDTVTVTVNTPPVITPIADTSLCAGDVVVLSAAVLPNTTYRWNTGATTFSITAAPQSQPYIVVLTSTINGCSSTDTVVVATKRTPVAEAGKNSNIFSGSTAQLQATTHTNNASYLWSPPTYLNNPIIPNPVTAAEEDILYRLTVTSQDNCVAIDSVMVFVKENISVPNVFSPNGDGINDTWQIPGLGSLTGIIVRVFDRYGKIVFESYGYTKEWDGKYNGKILPVAAYYYTINMNNYLPNKSGTITILK